MLLTKLSGKFIQMKILGMKLQVMSCYPQRTCPFIICISPFPFAFQALDHFCFVCLTLWSIRHIHSFITFHLTAQLKVFCTCCHSMGFKMHWSSENLNAPWQCLRAPEQVSLIQFTVTVSPCVSSWYDGIRKELWHRISCHYLHWHHAVLNAT